MCIEWNIARQVKKRANDSYKIKFVFVGGHWGVYSYENSLKGPRQIAHFPVCKLCQYFKM